MDILIDVSYGARDLQSIPVGRLAEFVIAQEGKPGNTEVSISFVDNDTMAEMNGRYRGIAGPTDVLSFECDNLEDGFAKASEDMSGGAHDIYQLGDILIAPDVARAQCAGFGNTFQQEIELLLVHGLLHLCGYDHIQDDEAQIMEARERGLLASWYEKGGNE